jgi:two-component system nitrogen regulation sensor histidine kinase NtrY
VVGPLEKGAPRLAGTDHVAGRRARRGLAYTSRVAGLPGKTERRLALALLLTSLVPLAAAIFLASSLLSHSANIWFDPEVGRQLDHGVDVYKDYVKAIKDDMKHQTDAISADELLREAAKKRNTELIEVQLDALFPRFPELVSLIIEDPEGKPLARRDRGQPVNEATELSLPVSRPLSSDPDPPQLVATFAIDRKRVDELETTGNVVTRYHQLEASRSDLYKGYLATFAALLGITILVTLVSGTVLARGVTRRINRLAAALNLVAEGDLSIRVPVTGSDEVTELARTFNRMLGEMEASRARIEFLQRIGAWQEMAQRLAHEIKNPLTPIQLAVQECHRKYAGDNPRFRALLDTTLEIVEEEVGTLRRLVGDFSNFARLPQAELRDNTLGDFLRECKEQLGHLEAESTPGEPLDSSESLGGLNVDVTWNLPTQPIPVAIDRQMLRRVLVNLVRNAVQAIRGMCKIEEGAPAGGEVLGHVVVSGRADGDGAAIVVEDDGPGIPPERRARVFDPYFTTKVDGTGLGLAIVKKIVVEHGGSIDAGSSERLGGAMFVIRLPGRKTLALAAAREARDRKSLSDVSQAGPPSGR